jgi:two-component system response regulator
VAKRNHGPKPDSDLQTRLGAFIRVRRDQLGITQEELAWRANRHRTYIADIERGARNVTLRSLVNLTSALQLTVANLFSRISAPAGTHLRAAGHDNTDGAREILLVDGSATDAARARRAFSRAKFANPIKVVSNGEQGLDYLFGTGRYAKRVPVRPLVILFDVNLPEMPPQEFLRRIKKDGRTRAIPVVFLTVSKSERGIIMCGRPAAEHYLVKPLSFENFVRVTPQLNLHLILGPLSVDRNRVSSV